MQKAGYKKSFESGESKIKITSYESSKTKLTYKEYKEWT
jgi:hypothetical protein